jgi:16S rRNA (uracil1498-N3)-methyltransferase
VSRHRCYAPDAASAHVELSPDEAHHLTHVLRAGPGTDVIVFDGHGHEWDARVASTERRRVVVELLAPRVPVVEPMFAVTLAAGLLKGDQMNTVVRDATALGAAAIQPFVSAHVAVPERAWRDRSADRWRRIAVSSAKQCGRSVVPAIGDIVRLPAVLAAHASATIVLCVEPARPGASAAIPRPGLTGADVLLCIGPEGGWAPDEIADARDRGAHLWGLGPRVLRAEIAPTVALSALWALWGW